MSHRPLVFVIGLTVGDYFLWNWSLNNNHDVIALISGLTFPPLALLLLWMFAVRATRLLARTAGRPAARRRAAAAPVEPAPRASRPGAARAAAAEGTERSSAARRKLAA